MTENVVWHVGSLSRDQRATATGGSGVTVWMTGLSGSGKSTVAYAVEQLLVDSGRAAYVVDGDNLRLGLNSDLGFSREDRSENVRRVSEVARLMSDAGVVTLAPLISPYRSDREAARIAHEAAGIPFIEVFVHAPLAVCEARDPKGLYEMARRGEIVGFTGIDDPYEEPERFDLKIDTAVLSTSAAAVAVVEKIDELSGSIGSSHTQ